MGFKNRRLLLFKQPIKIIILPKNLIKYLSVLKSRLNSECVELASICSQLKLPSPVHYYCRDIFSWAVNQY